MHKLKIKFNSLLLKLMMPMLVLAVLQGIIFYSVFVFTDTFNEIRSKSIDTLSGTVSNRAAYLYNAMVTKWSNFGEQSAQINKLISNAVYEFDENALDDDVKKPLTIDKSKLDYTPGKYSVSDLGTESANASKLNQYILKQVSDALVNIIFKSETSGVYFILTGQDDLNAPLTGTRNGLYYRTIGNIATKRDQLILSVAPSEAAVAYCSDFNTKVNHDLAFDFNGFSTYNQFSDSSFYSKTLQAARTALDGLTKGGQVSENFSRNYAYWATAYKFNNQKIISYNMPLVIGDTIYAVLGVDISDVMYRNMQDRLNLSSTSDVSFILTTHEKNSDTYNAFFDIGAVYTSIYGNAGQTLKIEESVTDYFHRLEKPASESGDIYIATANVQIYDNFTPHENTIWSVTGITRGDKLFAFPSKLQTIVVLSVVSSVALCIVAIIFVSIVISHPVNRLHDEIKTNKSFGLSFSNKTNILEVDLLVEEIRKLTENLADSGVRLERIIELAKMPLGAYEFSEGDAKVFCTGRMHRLLGFSDKPVPSGFMPIEEFNALMDGIKGYIYSASEDGSEIVYRFVDEMGYNWTRLYITHTAKSTLGVAVDITAEFTEKRLLEHERDHDSMTQLLNRRAYYNRAYELFKDTETLGICAVVMLDIDGLKYVNDTYGHDKGDKYIIATAKAIKASCGDRAVVARLAGDEFSLILYGGKSKDDIRVNTNAIMEKLRNTYVVFAEGVEQCIKASAGLAWFPDDALSFNKLLKYSDYAMYQIKNTVKGRLAEFDYKKYNEEMQVLQENEEFREIIAKHKVDFAFQPIISTETGTVYAYDVQYFGGLNFYKKQSDLIAAAVKTSLQYKMEDIVWTKMMELLSENNVSLYGAKIMFYTMADCMLSDRRLKELPDYKKQINKMILYSDPSDLAVMKLKKEFMETYGGGIALNLNTDIDDLSELLTVEAGMFRIDAQVLYDAYINTDERPVMLKKIERIKSFGNEILAFGIETEEQYELMNSLGFHYLQGNFICGATELPEKLY